MSNMLTTILNWIKEVFWKIFGFLGRKEVKADERLPEIAPVSKPEVTAKHKRRIPDLVLGKTFWLADDRHWFLNAACEETGINYQSVAGLRVTYPRRVRKVKKLWKAHMKEHGVPEYEMRADSSGPSVGKTDPLLVGKVIWLSKQPTLSIKSAAKLVDGVSSATVYQWRKHEPEKFAKAVALYEASIKEPEAVVKKEPLVSLYPSGEELQVRIEGKLSTRALKSALDAYADLGEMAGIIIADISIVWEIFLDLVQVGTRPDIALGVCKMLIVLDKDSSLTPRHAAKETGGSYGSYYGLSKDGGTQTKRFSKVFAAAKAAVTAKSTVRSKPKSASKKVLKALTKKKVEPEVDLIGAFEYSFGKHSKEAQVQAEEELSPKVVRTWKRMLKSCVLQMEQGLTPKEACKKAKLSYKLYLECKEANVYHQGDHFGTLAKEAEAAGSSLRLLKQQGQQ